MINAEQLLGFFILFALVAGILGRFYCAAEWMVECLRLRFTRRGRFEAYMQQRFH